MYLKASNYQQWLKKKNCYDYSMVVTDLVPVSSQSMPHCLLWTLVACPLCSKCSVKLSQQRTLEEEGISLADSCCSFSQQLLHGWAFSGCRTRSTVTSCGSGLWQCAPPLQRTGASSFPGPPLAAL